MDVISRGDVINRTKNSSQYLLIREENDASDSKKDES